MTIAHSLAVLVGNLSIKYDWHQEMQKRSPADKFDRFERIWTVIWVPIKLQRDADPESASICVEGDWCSPLMVKHLVRAYLHGMNQAVKNSLTDASDPANVLAAMEAL